MPVEAQQDQHASVNMRRLDTEGADPTPGDFDDKQQMMQTYARLTTVSEWRQLAAILDRLLFLVFLIVSVCVLFAMH